MFDSVTPPMLTAASGVATIAAAIAAVDLNIDAAFITAAGALIITLGGALTKVWRASMTQSARLAVLEAEVQQLRSDARERTALVERQDRVIAHLGATIDVLRVELDHRNGDGR